MLAPSAFARCANARTSASLELGWRADGQGVTHRSSSAAGHHVTCALNAVQRTLACPCMLYHAVACSGNFESRRRCGSDEPSPGADVAATSPFPEQMRQRRAQSRSRCGSDEPSPGADVAAGFCLASAGLFCARRRAGCVRALRRVLSLACCTFAALHVEVYIWCVLHVPHCSGCTLVACC